MSPEELLAAGHQMMRAGDPLVGSSRLIAAALLVRQALEDGVDRFWEQAGLAPLADVSGRAQLLCLPYYLSDRGLAREVSYCWHRLSDTIHHDVYDLPPAVGELDHLATIVGRFLDAAVAPTEAEVGAE